MKITIKITAISIPIILIIIALFSSFLILKIVIMIVSLLHFVFYIYFFSKKNSISKEKLLESEERYRSIIEYNLNLFIYIDTKGVITGYNKTASLWFEYITGFQISQGILATEILKDLHIKISKRDIYRISKQQPVSNTVEISSIFGEPVYLSYNFVPIFTAKGKHNGYSIMGTDISREKNNQDKIKALALISEDYPHPVMRLDYKGTIIYANKPAKDFLYVLNNKEGDIIDESLWEYINKSNLSSGTFEYPVFIENIDVVYSITYTKIDEPKYIGIIASDITAVIEKEKKIRSLYDLLLEDIETASSIVNYLLPPWNISTGDYEFFSSYEPSSKVGGDLLDCFDINNCKEKFICIGDVSGHGVQAALIMTAVKSTIRRIVENENSIQLHDLLNILNKKFSKELLIKNYLTLIVARLDISNNILYFCNAGHPPPLYINNKTGSLNILEDKGSIPLGWDDELIYQPSMQQNLELTPHSTFLLYTDGLLEASKQNKEINKNYLYSIIKDELTKRVYPPVPHFIKETLQTNGYSTSNDDYTIISIYRKNEIDSSSFITSLSTSLSEIREIGSKVYNFVNNISYDTNLAIRVEIIVNEIITNAIIHGTNEGIQHMFLSVEYNKDHSVNISLFEDGNEYDISSFMSPTFDELNESFAEHGRGLPLIRFNGTQIHYERSQKINRTVYTVF